MLRFCSYYSTSGLFLIDLFEFVFQDKDPIKTIDLEACQEVARDDSLGKGNCFR